MLAFFVIEGYVPVFSKIFTETQNDVRRNRKRGIRCKAVLEALRIRGLIVHSNCLELIEERIIAESTGLEGKLVSLSEQNCWEYRIWVVAI